ncbi:TetR/AcrR family transcriptional regulator [Lactobacillus sp. PV037]|uniref:TetR/AcrR family transcriptional regulator n=1 Tax=Lactobacillus sp. PV037 TaxID=2594496 RepID=UPI00223ED654|nr:TetR/AcrR family transcriptional regulator [Lactobacillus sp. PV037]QNQ84335.1 TetR/AcrR family transcriptional regulator [Lactobacillus sp. PV037]
MVLTNRQKRTQLDLIRTMESLLNRKKFEDITINDICSNALITRGTFYRYFKDKYELTQAVLEYIGERDLKDNTEETFFKI